MECCGKMKNIKEGLDHKSLREVTIKYHSDHRKHKYELIEEPKKQFNSIFMEEKLAIKVIMNCRTRLGLQQVDVVLTKEQSVLTKITNSFEGENTQT